MESMVQQKFHKWIIIPYERLSKTALWGLVEEFVTRDGTDSGYPDGSADENVQMVIRQLEHGEAVIVYDEDSASANIVAVTEARGLIG